MFRTVLELLVLNASLGDWKETRASCVKEMNEREDHHPILSTIAEMGATPAGGVLVDGETDILGEPLGDDPAAREFIAATERLVRETLDEFREDPAVEEFERAANICIKRLWQKIIEDPTTKDVVMARKMSRADLAMLSVLQSQE